MATWAEIEADAPGFAARVRERFADGEVTLGMMGGSRKLADVRRDPRIAVHSPTVEPAEGTLPGDAKLAGRVVRDPNPPEDPDEGAGFFRIDVDEVALTYLGEPADHLVIESWHPGRGWTRRTRR